jgi:hypothetical protein
MHLVSTFRMVASSIILARCKSSTLLCIGSKASLVFFGFFAMAYLYDDFEPYIPRNIGIVLRANSAACVGKLRFIKIGRILLC